MHPTPRLDLVVLKCSDFNFNLPHNRLWLCFIYFRIFTGLYMCVLNFCDASLQKFKTLEEPDPHPTTIFLEGHEGPETEND